MSSETDDVFQGDQPVIVDGDLLEAAKENIQPLASGRKATALSAVLSTPHAQRESKLAATRARLRINIEVAIEDDDDDPLEAYCQLIYWTVENYPQGHSAESGLLELLEEATRVLKDHRDGIWRSDLRYLKLWVLYASYVERPIVIYRYLLANEVGTTFALLYEEFAAVLERNGRRTDADETYLLGINRQASPVERLQTKHREFQRRMMLAAPVGATPQDSQPAAVTMTKRKVLGESATASKTSSRSTRAASGSTTATSGPQEDVFGSTAIAPSRPKPNARMQIFVDPSGEEAQAAEDSAATSWNELGARKERIKENVPEVKKAGGTTLRQPGRQQRVASGSGASVSRIPVFRDPAAAPAEAKTKLAQPAPVGDKDRARQKEVVPKTPARVAFVPFRDDVAETPATARFVPFKDEPTTPSTLSGTQIPESVMKVKKLGGGRGPSTSSEAEALRKDPLKNYPDRPLDVD
ncbi:Mad3/BUB1 homology region 1-domain-containing protein [Gloeopeniophorella convolvens]|nr:Mad3/BUB1 homology region 1-domain-containing protein [Gloeopeniophorella convolvens]